MAEGPQGAGAGAIFATAGIAFVFAGLFALERVGAPDALVIALGPLAGLALIAALGVLARAKTLLDFLVARREVPPFFAGLALTAPIGGFAVAFAGATSDPTRLPWRGAAAGIAFAALILAPRWRAAQASALADVLATRFPSVSVRAAFAMILVASGGSLAACGLAFAALVVRSALGLGPDAALALCAGALVVSLAPGGLRGLVWSDAATAAAGLMTVGLFAAISGGANGPERLDAAGAMLRQWPGAPIVQEIAAAAASGALFAFVAPALAVATPGAARRAGLTALLTLLVGGAAAASVGDLDAKSPGVAALAALVGSLPALALARAGLFAASRAAGFDLLRARKRLSVLASRRMAAVRGAVLLIAAAAAAMARLAPTPSAPLFFGLGLWLAFGAPSLVLALLPGRGGWPAAAALIGAAAAAAAGRLEGFGNPTFGPDMLVGALGAALAGLAAGVIAYVLAPLGSTPAVPDPFVELPGERL